MAFKLNVAMVLFLSIMKFSSHRNIALRSLSADITSPRTCLDLVRKNSARPRDEEPVAEVIV